jgi:tRNA threonylcarbamoyladenosine biosynthesis protein TsaB
MNLLAIDCTESPLTVAATNGAQTAFEKGNIWQKSSEQILPLIERALLSSQIEPSRLSAVALSSGPGSFTALRIGIATAKGLCCANDIPLILIPTFDPFAVSTFQRSPFENLFIIMHSKSDEFYVGVAKRGGEVLYDYLTVGALNQKIKSFRSVAIVGRNLSKWIPLIEADDIIDGAFFTAESFLSLAKEKFEKGEFSDLATAEPLYLKNFEAKKKP